MMKKVLFALVMVMLAVSPALAFDLGTYVGPLQLQFVNYDVGTLYTSADNGTGKADGNADSFAIVSITSILGGSDQLLWAKGTPVFGNEYITGLVYGLDDNAVNVDAVGTGSINSVGGKIALYLKSTDFSPAAGVPPAMPMVGLSAPGDLWNAIAPGTPFLTLDFIPGILAPTDYTTTYHQDLFVFASSGAVFGQGNGYLKVTGGTAAGIFGAYDYAFNDSFTNLEDPKGWLVKSNGLAASIPEPASMILFGIGLFGAARLRRKN